MAWAGFARGPVIITVITTTTTTTTTTATIITITVTIIITIIITTIIDHAGPLTRAAARPGGTRARVPGAGP